MFEYLSSVLKRHLLCAELGLPAQCSGLKVLAIAVTVPGEGDTKKGDEAVGALLSLLWFSLLLWLQLCNRTKLDRGFEAADCKRVLDKLLPIPAECI